MNKTQARSQIQKELKKRTWSVDAIRNILDTTKEDAPQAAHSIKNLSLGDAFLAMRLATGATEEDIKSKSRKMEYKIPRQVLMTYLPCNNHNGNYSPTSIGRLLGKNHATVLHAIKTVGNMIYTKDERYLFVVDRFLQEAKSINPNATDSFEYLSRFKRRQLKHYL
jgi:chromosomal replication initiation ATPase DnaA